MTQAPKTKRINFHPCVENGGRTVANYVFISKVTWNFQELVHIQVKIFTCEELHKWWVFEVSSNTPRHRTLLMHSPRALKSSLAAPLFKTPSDFEIPVKSSVSYLNYCFKHIESQYLLHGNVSEKKTISANVISFHNNNQGGEKCNWKKNTTIYSKQLTVYDSCPGVCDWLSALKNVCFNAWQIVTWAEIFSNAQPDENRKRQS